MGEHAPERRTTLAAREKARGYERKNHPTTSEMDYSPEEMEFMSAIQRWKRRTGKQFPTWAEVLEVCRSIGYSKDSPSCGAMDL